MDIFKKASKQKLRFDTNVGTLSTDDLWDLNLNSLNYIAKSYNKAIKESEEDSFIEESKVDPSVQLSFEIVLSVIEAKIADKKKAEKVLATKEKNQKILSIMSRKEDSDLEGKSYEELKDLLESE